MIKAYIFLILMILALSLMSGCVNECGIIIKKVNENDNNYYHISNNLYSEYPNDIQQIIQSGGEVLLTDIQQNIFLNSTNISRNKILICNDEEKHVFKGYVEYNNISLLIDFNCKSNGLLMSALILEKIAYNITKSELNKLPVLSQFLSSGKKSGSLPRDEWDYIWDKLSYEEEQYIKYNNSFYQIDFITT